MARQNPAASRSAGIPGPAARRPPRLRQVPARISMGKKDCGESWGLWAGTLSSIQPGVPERLVPARLPRGASGAPSSQSSLFPRQNRQILPAKCCFRPLSRPLPDPAKGLYCRVAFRLLKMILALYAVLRLQLRTETNSIRKPPQTTRGIHLRPERNLNRSLSHVNRQGGPDNGQY